MIRPVSSLAITAWGAKSGAPTASRDDWTQKRNGNCIDLPPTLYHLTMIPRIIGSQPLVMLSPACFGCRYCLSQGFSLSGVRGSSSRTRVLVGVHFCVFWLEHGDRKHL